MRQAQRQKPAAAGAAGGSRTAWKAVFFGLAGAAIVVAAAWALLGSRFLVVRSAQVTITGRLVSRAQVVSAARIPFGLPLIRVNTGTIARRVEQITQVQSADVSKNWPSTIVIKVQSRTPVFARVVPGGYDIIDRFGVAVRQVAHRPASLPLLSAGAAAGSAAGNAAAVSAAATVMHELPRGVARRVSEVTAADASDVSVRLTNGVVIVWGDTRGAAQKAQELTLLMRRQARLYDVSAPGTAATRG
jgi:cell division protein FtsQ